ncbi:hypothetical protein V8E36_005887 [Tilletia maclaganii]
MFFFISPTFTLYVLLTGTMICQALISAAAPLLLDDGPPGTAHHLYQDGSAVHTVQLFRRGQSHAQSEFRSEADVHTHIKAELDRVTNKYSAMGFKHYVATRSGKGLLQERTTGSLPLTPINDGTTWTGMIRVGTGRGEVSLAAIFDTDSSDLIILPGQYGSTRSTSAQDTGQPFQAVFFDGNHAEGRVILETVHIAGLEARNVPISNAAASTLNAGDFQSIVGMRDTASPSTLTRPGLMTTLLAQGSLQRNVYGFGLWQSAEASLDLGFVPRQYRGQISWTDVIDPQNGFWSCYFSISGLAGAEPTLVDTGSSVITGPMELVMTVLTQAGMQTYEHKGVLYGVYYSEGPTPYVSINIAGLDIVLSAQSLAYSNRGRLTIAGIVGRHGTGGYWLLGGAFLQNVYAVFDGQRHRIGFAPH